MGIYSHTSGHLSFKEHKKQNIISMDGRFGEWNDYFNEDVKDALFLVGMHNSLEILKGTTVSIKDSLKTHIKQTDDRFKELDKSLKEMENSIIQSVHASIVVEYNRNGTYD